jgi:hypothetical protein
MGWIAVVAAPWNPALWWQLRRLRLAIEVDCDRRVLNHGVSLDRYGALLLEVGRRISIRPLVAVGLFETRSFLERRVRAMTASASRRALRSIAALGAVAIVIGLAVAAPVPVKPQRTVAAGQGTAEPSVVAPAVQDTPPRFSFTPFTVKPICTEKCSAEDVLEYMEAAGAPAACEVMVGIQIDTIGRPTATDILKTGDPACDEGARSWAMATRWTPAENEGRPVVAWIAQPIAIGGDEATIESGVAPDVAEMVDPPPPPLLDGSGFVFTPYTVRPECLEGCTKEALGLHLREVARDRICAATIGVLISTSGEVTATDMLRPSGDEACDQAIARWARTTRWSPAKNGTEPVEVWIAQPLQFGPEEGAEAGSAPADQNGTGPGTLSNGVEQGGPAA